jgi:branched-chain amino acid transport system ATP-binding protein
VTCLNNGRFLAEGAPAEIRGNADVQDVYLGKAHRHA